MAHLLVVPMPPLQRCLWWRVCHFSELHMLMLQGTFWLLQVLRRRASQCGHLPFEFLQLLFLIQDLLALGLGSYPLGRLYCADLRCNRILCTLASCSSCRRSCATWLGR